MKVSQHIYEIRETNYYLFDFIAKELLYMKNNSSEYELRLLH
jgi:hypothetical protein